MTCQGTSARLIFAAVSAAAALAFVPVASAQTAGSAAAPVASASAKAPALTLALKGKKRPGVLDKVIAQGVLKDAGKHENVFVTVRASGRKLFTKKAKVNGNTGVYRLPITVDSCCKYKVSASHVKDRARPQTFSVQLPGSLGKGPRTRLFNDLLRKEGFHMGSVTNRVNQSTAYGIMAFRKVNRMSRVTAYSPAIFRLLLQGKGRFIPKEQKKGRYVEVDISRQVMALIEDGVATHVFPVSTGAPATPTNRGHFHFYMKQAGYNAKAMYYSVYFIRGYATHGYHDVPTYNASHGCVRNPIPYSRFIYNWIDLGDPIYTYL